jgi:hypothetical protein
MQESIQCELIGLIEVMVRSSALRNGWGQLFNNGQTPQPLGSPSPAGGSKGRGG